MLEAVTTLARRERWRSKEWQCEKWKAEKEKDKKGGRQVTKIYVCGIQRWRFSFLLFFSGKLGVLLGLFLPSQGGCYEGVPFLLYLMSFSGKMARLMEKEKSNTSL